MTNIPELAQHLDEKCSKDHIHGHLLGGTARHAQKYTPQFVHAIIKGLKAHLRRRGYLHGQNSKSVHFEYYDPTIETCGQNLGEKCASVLTNYLVSENKNNAYFEEPWF